MADPKLWLVTRSEVTQFLVRADTEEEAKKKVRPPFLADGDPMALRHEYHFNVETKRVSLWHGEIQ